MKTWSLLHFFIRYSNNYSLLLAKLNRKIMTNNYISSSFDSLVTKENLYNAYLTASKGKKQRKATQAFSYNLGYELDLLYRQLKTGTYKPRPVTQFEIWCTAGQKTRLISASHFRDCVVQHLLYDNLYTEFDRTFIFDSYGCRRGKGTHKCADRVMHYLRSTDSDRYYVQLDIRKYYYSINHVILKQAIQRVVKDERIVELLCMFMGQNEVGLNVGSLLSQLFGLIYLNYFDHYCKRVLKVKKYARYVDDIVFVDLTREQAEEIAKKTQAFLEANLKLTLSKVKINKVTQGLNFVGFRTFRNYRIVRKRSLHNFGRKLRVGKVDSLTSIIAHSKNSTSYKHFVKRLSTSPINSSQFCSWLKQDMIEWGGGGYNS